MQLPSGQEFEIRRFAGGKKPLLLWLPSERGFNAAHAGHASDMAQAGFEVWLADLHGAYFVEPGRRSITKFPLDDVMAIIDAATAAADHGVYLLSTSRGAQLALIAAREWQLQNPGQAGIHGIFLAHAYLYSERPAAGQNATYLPIVGATNLPVYLLDAQYSTRSARLGELAQTLGVGGSQVFKRILPGVQGGFIARDKRDLEPPDLAARRDFAATLEQGIVALALITPPRRAVETTIDTRHSLIARRGSAAILSRPAKIDPSATIPTTIAAATQPQDCPHDCNYGCYAFLGINLQDLPPRVFFSTVCARRNTESDGAGSMG